MNKKLYIIIICLLAITKTQAQDIPELNLKEFTYSANKYKEQKKDIAQKIEIIDSAAVQFNNPFSAGDMLSQTGKVFVQTSQQGGGSPILRGFEANKILMIVDGVRMNNAIYRGGHLQNVITIDPNILERTEILFGPGSTIYGSDALGGVISFYTQRPILADSSAGKRNISGVASSRYIFNDGNGLDLFSKEYTNSNSYQGNATLNIGFKKFAVLGSFTYKMAGDIRSGALTNPYVPNFGKRPDYVQRIDGKDSIFRNDNPFKQIGSGYSQYDATLKALYQINKNTTLLGNFQFSNSSDVPRYDRLTDIRNGKLRYGRWDYGPQVRMLGSLTLENKKANKLYDEIRAIVSMQGIEESRITRNLNSNDETTRKENVTLPALTIDAKKELSKDDELRYGIDVSYNLVNSESNTLNLKTNSNTEADTRYPKGGSNMLNTALYGSNSWEINEKLIFSQGVRFNYISLHSDFGNSKFYPVPVNEVNQTNMKVTGSLGLVYLPAEGYKISGQLASGFRAPNVDDVGKVFESANKIAIVPNPDLKAENNYTAEITFTKTLEDIYKFEITYYQSYLLDAITTKFAQFNGQDSIIYNGVNSKVTRLENANKAVLNGVQFEFDVKATKSFLFTNNFTYSYGRNVTDNVPLDHIPSMYGQSGIKYQDNKWMANFFMQWNGWKRIKDFNPFGEDNQQYATPQGMPSWFTLNIKSEYKLNKLVKIQAGIENLLDQQYRLFASGISGAGRNVYIGCRVRF